MSAGDPLAPYGYVVNRLTPAKDGKGFVCADPVAQGAPLLAVPASACWTAEAAEQECPLLAGLLGGAQARSPHFKVLGQDDTWIVLHMLYGRHRNDGVAPARSAHLASLLGEEPETMLAWKDTELEELRGSWWYDEVKRRQKKIANDFRILRAELGEEALAELGVAEGTYRWARHIIQQLGVQIATAAESYRTMLVPGLELLLPDASLAPSVAGARLEITMTGSSPVFVVYAEREFYAGEQVFLQHGGLVGSTGSRVMGCGRLLESSPWESVQLDLPLRMDMARCDSSEFSEMLDMLTEGLRECFASGMPQPQCGECRPPDLLNGEMPVKLGEDKDGHPELRVTLQFGKQELLPSKYALVCLGVALMADSGRQEQIMLAEKDVQGVFNDDCCERRALSYLQVVLQQALDRYPKELQGHMAQVAKLESAPGELLPRATRCLCVLTAERRLLTAALGRVRQSLGSPAKAQPGVAEKPGAWKAALPQSDENDMVLAISALSSDSDSGPASDFGKTMEQLKGKVQAFEQLAERFLLLRAEQKLDAADGIALMEELSVLRASLSSCLLGDPLAAPCVPMHSSDDPMVKLFGEAHLTLLYTLLAAQEWQQSCLEQASKDGSPALKEAAARTIAEVATLRMRLLDFDSALGDLKHSLEVQPGIPEVMDLAEECAMCLAAQSGEVLGSAAWAGKGKTLEALRVRLQQTGYSRAVLKWDWPCRLPVVHNMAADAEAWSGRDLGSERVDAPEGREHDVVDLVRLFMLHRPLPLARAAELLGPEACGLLLERRALACYDRATAKLLEAGEAAKLVPAGGKTARGLPEVFANILLWPVDEDVLVAFDFEQVHCLGGKLEPVPCLAQDSRALMHGAPRSPQAAQVLDAYCGSGAQGIAALRHYASNATFMDSNPRALCFARFNAAMNGVEEKSSFVEGSIVESLPSALQGKRFDAVLMNHPHVPNPSTAITCGQPFGGGADGEKVLSALLAKAARSLLAPGGRCVATAMAVNPGGLANRLVDWADAGGEPADFHAVVFRDEPLPLPAFWQLATKGQPILSRAAYLRGMENLGVHSVSRILVLLRAPTDGAKVPEHAARVDSRPERRGLWADVASLQAEVQGAMDDLIGMSVLDVDPSGQGDGELYTLDWNDGIEEAGTVKKKAPRAAADLSATMRGGWWAVQQGKGKEYSITLDKTDGTNLGAKVNHGDGKTLLIEAVLGGLFKDWNIGNPRKQVNPGDRIVEVNGVRGNSQQLLSQCKKCQLLQVVLRREADRTAAPQKSPTQKGQLVAENARWKDVALHNVLGFAPPCLVDLIWQETAAPPQRKLGYPTDKPPTNFRIAIVELKGCRCPAEVRDGLRMINCWERFTYDSSDRELKPLDKNRPSADFNTTLQSFDTILLPLEYGATSHRKRPIIELPYEVLSLITSCTQYIVAVRAPLRIVVLTCGATGPIYENMQDDGYGMPASTPIRGLLRCSRIETVHMPILHIDSDALVEPGRGETMAAQVNSELELSTPEGGFWKADQEQQNKAIVYTNREVIYRGDTRYQPKLDLCARNPLFPGAKIDMLTGAAADGVALVTGGTGGLGLTMAQALAELGVKNLVLSSRSGQVTRGYQGLDKRLDELRKLARVELMACDVGNEESVINCLDRIRKDIGPLRHVMNAAGVALPQDPALMEATFKPKAEGAWFMHKHTLRDDLKSFVLFSSMSAMAGANELGNYAAANTYIDQLASYRQHMGLPAVSIVFPEVEEAGMAADMVGQGSVATVPLAPTKQAMRQVINGKGHIGPSTPIMVVGYLIPRTPVMESMIEPLRQRVNKELYERLAKEEASFGKVGPPLKKTLYAN